MGVGEVIWPKKEQVNKRGKKNLKRSHLPAQHQTQDVWSLGGAGTCGAHKFETAPWLNVTAMQRADCMCMAS